MSDPNETGFDPKDGLGAVYKDGEIAGDWSDVEPLITPAQLRRLHLFDLPLVSAIKNPWTHKPYAMDDPKLADIIKEAVSLAELEGGFDIFQREFKEKAAFDRHEMDAFGYIRLRHLPASKLISFKAVSADGDSFWDVPTKWIETGMMHQGQINIIPYAIANQSGSVAPVMGPGPIALMPKFFNFQWVPSYWEVQYRSGFPDGRIPRVVNQLIGVIAAMEILSALGATFARTQSSSLGIDGLSQSISTPGPNLFAARLQELGEKRRWIIKKLRHNLGLGFILSNI